MITKLYMLMVIMMAIITMIMMSMVMMMMMVMIMMIIITLHNPGHHHNQFTIISAFIMHYTGGGFLNLRCDMT